MKTSAVKSVARAIAGTIALAAALGVALVGFAYCLGDLTLTDTLLASAALVSLAFANWLLSIAD